MNNSLPIVILSSDKYSDVLKDLLAHIYGLLTDRYTVYYSVNTRECMDMVEGHLSSNVYKSLLDHSPCIRYRPLYSGSQDWSITLRSAAEVLQNNGFEKALFTLEDFFVTSIDYKKISQAFESSADIMYVSYRPCAASTTKLRTPGIVNGAVPHRMPLNVFKISSFNKYGISLQPAVWNLSSLVRYINLFQPVSPWDFERSFGSTNLQSVYRLRSPAFLYADQALERGRWFPFKALRHRRVSTKPILAPAAYLRICARTGISKLLDIARNMLARLIFAENRY